MKNFRHEGEPVLVKNAESRKRAACKTRVGIVAVQNTRTNRRKRLDTNARGIFSGAEKREAESVDPQILPEA